MTLAARPTRLLGQIVDGLVGVGPMLLSIFAAPFGSRMAIVVFLMAALWAVFYYFFADGLDGGSVGKRLLGMRVIGAQDGAPCSFGQSFIRNLLLAVLGPLDWVFIFGEQHQRLGDKAAGTLVVVE